MTVRKYNKVLVPCIISEADKSLKQGMESHLVGDLMVPGYNAFSAFKV